MLNSRREKDAGMQAVEKKRNEEVTGRQNNGPSEAAREVLSWSRSLILRLGWNGAHGNRQPEPACNLGTPGGERWNVPRLRNGCTGSGVGWELESWLREAGLGKAWGRGYVWMDTSRDMLTIITAQGHGMNTCRHQYIKHYTHSKHVHRMYRKRSPFCRWSWMPRVWSHLSSPLSLRKLICGWSTLMASRTSESTQASAESHS